MPGTGRMTAKIAVVVRRVSSSALLRRVDLPSYAMLVAFGHATRTDMRILISAAITATLSLPRPAPACLRCSELNCPSDFLSSSILNPPVCVRSRAGRSAYSLLAPRPRPRSVFVFSNHKEKKNTKPLDSASESYNFIFCFLYIQIIIIIIRRIPPRISAKGRYFSRTVFVVNQ